MAEHKFTPAQLQTLKSALRFDGVGGRCQYAGFRDATMRVLNHIGYAEYVRAQKYGKDHWYITDLGIERAKELFPAEAKALSEFQRS